MTSLLRLNDRFWPLLTLLLLAAVSGLSLTPQETALPSPGGHDKLLHFLAHAAIAAPVALARPRGWVWLLAGFALWGVAIEFIQPLVGRQRSAADMLANLAGILAAVAAAGALRGRVLRRRDHDHPAAAPTARADGSLRSGSF